MFHLPFCGPKEVEKYRFASQVIFVLHSVPNILKVETVVKDLVCHILWVCVCFLYLTLPIKAAGD